MNLEMRQPSCTMQPTKQVIQTHNLPSHLNHQPQRAQSSRVRFSQKYPPVKILSEKDWKRILITGGACFVGSQLTDKLMMDGHDVTAVDNFFTGRKRNMEHWIGHENFELINHDVALHRVVGEARGSPSTAGFYV
uniref:NAD-dependent epimerase/dehydratase domain-containing protein n=1 Tax=Oncorhynchus tshawytscha TaxID=74940 RepID=A0AAZ3SKY8_ONCTS